MAALSSSVCSNWYQSGTVLGGGDVAGKSSEASENGEIAEEGLARIMHKWINEEFAYLNHKRKQGNYDFKEEQRIRQELQIHELDGNNVEDWFSLMEEAFYYYQLDEDTSLKMAILALNGEVRTWFESEHPGRRVGRWSDLRRWLRDKIGGKPEEAGGEEKGLVGSLTEHELGVSNERKIESRVSKEVEDFRILKEKEDAQTQTLDSMKTTKVVEMQKTEKKMENEKIKLNKQKKNISESTSGSFNDGEGTSGNHPSLVVLGITHARRKDFEEGLAGACGSGGGHGGFHDDCEGVGVGSQHSAVAVEDENDELGHRALVGDWGQE